MRDVDQLKKDAEQLRAIEDDVQKVLIQTFMFF